MKVLVSGGSGFIGRALCSSLVASGHTVGVVSRRPERTARQLPRSIDMRASVEDFQGFEPEVIINLAGEPIANRRWTEARKQRLIQSRVGMTDALVSLAGAASEPPKIFISASAVGFYGDCGDAEVTEARPHGDGFSATLCQQWEHAAEKAGAVCGRVCIMRIGLVLDQPGGLLDRFVPPFKFGLGGRFGTGRQYMPWIHRNDVIRVIEHLMSDEQLSGVFNVSAPNPVSNAQFTKTLGIHLHRPACLPMPGFVVRTIFGEMSELMLEGARMVPSRLLHAGFTFNHPTLDEALDAIFSGQ